MLVKSLTGDRPLPRQEAKKLAKWWNQQPGPIWVLILAPGCRKTHKLYHVVQG